MKPNQYREPWKLSARSVLSVVATMLLNAIVAQAVEAAPDSPALPDPIMTPGQADPEATATIICAHDTKSRRRVSASVKEQVLAGYSVALDQEYKYEIDHLIPLALGGANTAANLWPQSMSEAVQKDALEVDMQRLVCHGLLPLDQAQW